jgi:hypothetical protein
MLLNRLCVITCLTLTTLIAACEVPTVQSPAGSEDGPVSGLIDDDAGRANVGDTALQTQDSMEMEVLEPPEQELVLGVNVTGKNTPEFFSELPDGGDLFVELGAQGLWMVVLAFRTHGYFDSKVIIRAWIEVDGIRQGELALAKQKLLPGGDGWDYYYNFFLVVPDPGLAGREAVVTMQVEDDLTQETVVLTQLNVLLTGGEL